MLSIPKTDTLLIKVKRFPVEKNLSRKTENPAKITMVTIKMINSWLRNFNKCTSRYQVHNLPSVTRGQPL